MKRRLSPEEIILNSYEFEEWLCNTATPMGDDGFSEKLFWYDAWEEYLGSSDK